MSSRPTEAASTESVDRAARRRILHAYLVAALALGPAYASFFAFFGAWHSFIAPAVFTLLTGAAWELKRREQCEWATRLLLAALWLGPAWATATTGGLASPIVIWLAPSPFMAGALIGPRAALRVGGSSVALALLMGLVSPAHLVTPELTSGLGHTLLQVMAATSAVALLTFYGWTTTRNFQQAQREIAHQHAALEAQNRDMASVLDNVAQGLLLVDMEGRVLPSRSAALTRWFGSPPDGTLLWDYAAPFAPTTAAMLRLGWDGLRDGFLPPAVVLGQLPQQVAIGERTWSLAYQPVGKPDAPAAVLIVLSDITETLAAADAQVQSSELLALFERYVTDPITFARSRAELDGLVRGVLEAQDRTTLMRRLHTIKGTGAACGLLRLPRLVHDAEERLREDGCLSTDRLAEVVAAWHQVFQRTAQWTDDAHQMVVVHERELDALREAILRGRSSTEVLQQIDRLRWERVDTRLHTLASQALKLAARLDKPEPEVVVDAGGVVVPPGWLDGLWPNLVHLVRNAIDHGIESAAIREQAGKSPHGCLRMHARIGEAGFTLTIADDGAGIDWARVAHKARELKLAAETREDLEKALFTDGLTTRETVSDISGRGIGLAAVVATVTSLGGQLDVDSSAGQGTTWTLRIPLHEPQVLAA